MDKTNRHIPPLCTAALLLLLLLSGCGGSTKKTATASTSTASDAAATKGPVPISGEIAAAVPMAGGAARGGAVLVHVGGEVITRAAFDRRMAIEAHAESPQHPIVPVPPGYRECVATLRTLGSETGGASSHAATTAQLKSQCAQSYERLKTHVLTELISDEWVIGGAAELGIQVSDQEARQRLQHLAVAQYGSQSKFDQFVGASDENISDLLFNIKVELLEEKLHQRAYSTVPHVTSAFVASYYKAHPAKFTTLEERDLGMIRTRSTKTAHRVKVELESGVSVAKAAERVGHQPYFLASTQGLLKKVTKRAFHDKAFTNALFSAKSHVVSGPARLNLFPGYHPRFHRNPLDVNNIDGYYVFIVEAVRLPRLKPLAEVESSLQRDLVVMLRKQAVKSFILPLRAKWRPKTDCAAGYVVRKCRQYKPVAGEEPEDEYTIN